MNTCVNMTEIWSSIGNTGKDTEEFMKISTKGRYALRIMIDLAANRSDEPIPLKDIAQRQDISVKYLEQIIPLLTKAGYVKGVICCEL